MRQTLKKILPFLPIFCYDLFFIFNEIFGYRYEGSENSRVYFIYLTIILLITTIILFNDLIVNKTAVSKKNIMLILINILIISMFITDIIFNGITSVMITRFLYFIIWGVSSILMGIYLSKYNRFENIVYFLDIFNILINIALVRSVSYSIINNSTVTLGGASYQNAGYVFAFGFGINLFLIIFGNNFERYNFTKNLSYKVLSIIFLFFQAYGIIATGARGAMLLFILYGLLIFRLSMNSLKQFIKYSLMIILLSVIIFLVWPAISEIPIISNSWDRIFAYIGADGIDWSGTSGRDVVYGEAINAIRNSPVIGYGLFNYFNIIPFPHNIILEILLQGGVVLLSIFIMIISILILKVYLIIKQDDKFLIYTIVISYPFIVLMFSGSYLSDSIFWFMISLVFSLDINDIKSKTIMVNQ